MKKRIGPVVLELSLEDAGVYIYATYDQDGEVWQGVASFPWEMEDEAALWIDRIESADDLEDLLREFSPEETWNSFQRFRNLIGV